MTPNRSARGGCVSRVKDGLLLMTSSQPQASHVEPHPCVLAPSSVVSPRSPAFCPRSSDRQVPGSVPHAYYACDGNGNVTWLIYPNGQVAARYLYDPFGNLLAAVGPLAEANLYRFSSKEWHRSSALVYYGYRFYDPSLQRWVSRDPYGEIGNAIAQLKFCPSAVDLFQGALAVTPVCVNYVFVCNDPQNATDPEGEWPRKLDAACEFCFVTPAMWRAHQAYRDALKRLHEVYGDTLPDWADNFMNRWRQDLIRKFGPCVVKPIVETVPGTTTTGPPKPRPAPRWAARGAHHPS